MMLRLLALLLTAPLAAFGQSYSTNSDPNLDLYIRQALDRNPSVRQSFARYESSLTKPAQAGALPDPMLGVTQHIRRPETRVGSQTTALTLSQQFPWFGKLDDREAIAVKEAAIARENHEARKAELVRQVKTAYYTLVFIDRTIAIIEQDLSVLGLYETQAQSRYAQGVGLQQAVIKLQAEMTRDRNRLQEWRARRVDAEATLNALLDRPAGTEIPVISMPARPRAELRSEELLSEARENRPELRAAFEQIEREEKRIHLAKRNYWPDFMVGAAFTNIVDRADPAGILMPPDQNGKNIYSLTFSLNIPIRRRKYDAALQEATEDKLAAQEGYRSIVNSIEASIRSAGFRLQTLEEQISLFERTLLPQAEQALRSTEMAYATGLVGVLDLLDSERVLLEIRIGLAQMETDYMKTLAELERAVGSAFPAEKRP